ELQEKASQLIARATGAEAGFVTGGAAAGLLQGTAACLAGDDPTRIERLPDVAGVRNEALIHRAHRNGYDHSVRAAGARIVEVGYPHTTLPSQLESAISERTALIVYLVAPWAIPGALSLPLTCQIAREHGIPVLVDAAAALPPAGNLTRFVADGADLVTFSGGKGLGGPQSSGILAGRADLIESAKLNGSPRHSIGRPAKTSKEDIVGLMVALERYLLRDHDADIARWRVQAELMRDRLSDLPGVTATVLHSELEHHTPRVEIVFDPATGIDAHELVVTLEEHDPRVFLFEPTGPSRKPNSVVINTHTMQSGEEEIVADAVRTAIASRLTAQGELLPRSLLVQA
ncbi:MAG: aminotransferase class V-fold PLP-dependent enzyme, partial [Thermomicrobiales bacterium]